jgi:hypothetical protein
MTVMIEVSRVLANSKFFVESAMGRNPQGSCMVQCTYVSDASCHSWTTQSECTHCCLMTDDLANRQKAEKDGIVSISGAFTSYHYLT